MMSIKSKLFIVIAVVFTLVGVIATMGCLRRDIYFSNSSSKEIVARYFAIETTLTPDASQPDSAFLEISLDLKDSNNTKVEPDKIKVYPVIAKLSSLKQIDSSENHYVFEVPMDKFDNSTLDILLEFKLDSSARVIDKSISFKGLKKITRYRWGAFRMH